ncbi:MAG TPA: discoidin domain-containing protein [Clostridia bacterium]
MLSFKRRIMAIALGLLILIGVVGCANNQEKPDPITVMPKQFTKEADRSERNGEKREWNNVSSFFCNYGSFQEEMLKYDVAIVESSALKDEDVQALEEAGVWKIAYITIGEDDSLKTADGLGPGGYASYYIYVDDTPVQNGNWGSYFVDAGNPVWQASIIAQAREIIDQGYDGLFLDTVDTVDVYPSTINGMYNLIKLLRETFPEIKLVMNRGFSTLPTIHEYIDGIMFESFSTYYDSQRGENYQLAPESSDFIYNQNVAVNTINAIRQKHYFPVFCLDYFTDSNMTVFLQAIYNTAWEYDFIPYVPLGGRLLSGEVTPSTLIPKSQRGIKALVVDNPAGAPVVNGDTSKDNLAYKGNGTIVSVDSTYPQYGYSCLIDGYIGNEENINLIDWSKIAWASAENTSDHWIQLDLDKAAQVKTMIVHWALDGGAYWSSTNVKVQAFINNNWVDIGEATNIQKKSPSTTIELNVDSPVTRVRLLQEAGNGPYGRSNLMWVSEVMLYA